MSQHYINKYTSINLSFVQDISNDSTKFVINLDGQKAQIQRINKIDRSDIEPNSVKILRISNTIVPDIVTSDLRFLGIKSITKKTPFKKVIDSLDWPKKDRKTYKTYYEIDWIPAKDITNSTYLARLIPKLIPLSHDFKQILINGKFNEKTNGYELIFDDIEIANIFRDILLYLNVCAGGYYASDQIVLNIKITQEFVNILEQYEILVENKVTTNTSCFKYKNLMFNKVKSIKPYDINLIDNMYDVYTARSNSYSTTNAIIKTNN